MITSLHEAVAARCNRSGFPIAAAGVDEIDRMFCEERARHGEADRLRGDREAAAVHVQGDAR